MKMTVLYVKDTGQVMAAVTRTVTPDAGPPTPEGDVSSEVLSLVGDSLPVRSFPNEGASGTIDPTLFLIPVEQLASLTVDLDEDQLLRPRAFTVLDKKKIEVPSGVVLPTPTLLPDKSTLEVGLGAAVLTELPIALHLVPESGAAGPPLHLLGSFKPGTTTAQKVSFTLRSPLAGDYGVLILLRGYRSAMRRLSA